MVALDDVDSHSGGSGGEDGGSHGSHGHGHGKAAKRRRKRSSHSHSSGSSGSESNSESPDFVRRDGILALHSSDEDSVDGAGAAQAGGAGGAGGMSRRAVWIFFSVVSLESVISGSAMGVATKFIGALVVFIAIVTHIWAEAFALMASVLKAGFTDKEAFRIAIYYALMTPAGTFMGMILQQALKDNIEATKIISAVLMAFAAGTFLYVAIVELIAEEFESLDNKWTKLNFMLLGFAFMTVLAAWL